MITDCLSKWHHLKHSSHCLNLMWVLTCVEDADQARELLSISQRNSLINQGYMSEMHHGTIVGHREAITAFHPQLSLGLSRSSWRQLIRIWHKMMSHRNTCGMRRKRKRRAQPNHWLDALSRPHLSWLCQKAHRLRETTLIKTFV